MWAVRSMHSVHHTYVNFKVLVQAISADQVVCHAQAMWLHGVIDAIVCAAIVAWGLWGCVVDVLCGGCVVWWMCCPVCYIAHTYCRKSMLLSFYDPCLCVCVSRFAT